MASNPMQKKARNSFILGVLVSLIVFILIGAMIYFLALNPSSKTKNGKKVTAYVLREDVESGGIITPEMLTEIEIYETMKPANYIQPSDISLLEFQDNDGYTIRKSNGKMYIEDKNKKQYAVTEENGNYYVNKNGTQEKLEKVPVIAKVKLYKNTLLTTSCITKADSATKDNARYVEYNMLMLETQTKVGDFVDVRLTFPNGQDLIVVSKKRVESIIENTIRFKMTEDDINMMESAIVEAYIMNGSKLYVATYVEAGNQKTATQTYVPTPEVQALIKGNPNIEREAREALASWFDNPSGGAALRTYEQNEVKEYDDKKQTNIEEGIQKEIENAKTAREAYLATLKSARNKLIQKNNN